MSRVYCVRCIVLDYSIGFESRLMSHGLVDVFKSTGDESIES